MNWKGKLIFCVFLIVCQTVYGGCSGEESLEEPDLFLEDISAESEESFEHEATGQKSTSLPKLDNSDYEEKGTVTALEDGLNVYSVGNSSKCIIWNYDIFGFSAGRTRQLCDYFADQGYFVILPDYFRGPPKLPWLPGGADFIKTETNWTKLYSDWLLVKDFAVENGAETFGAIGTCWGSYPVVRLSTLPEFSAGVSMHPSHSPIMKQLGEDEESIYEEIVAPQLLMPSKSDDGNVKLGGLAEDILGANVTIVEFNDMSHGWTSRGNLSDPIIDRDVHKAISLAVDFFNQHL